MKITTRKTRRGAHDAREAREAEGVGGAGGGRRGWREGAHPQLLGVLTGGATRTPARWATSDHAGSRRPARPGAPEWLSGPADRIAPDGPADPGNLADPDDPTD